MELRKLKALLGALRAAGVTSYRDADVTLELGPTFAPVDAGDVETGYVRDGDPNALGPDWAAGAPLTLQQAYDRIRGEYRKKKAAA